MEPQLLITFLDESASMLTDIRRRILSGLQGAVPVDLRAPLATARSLRGAAKMFHSQEFKESLEKLTSELDTVSSSAEFLSHEKANSLLALLIPTESALARLRIDMEDAIGKSNADKNSPFPMDTSERNPTENGFSQHVTNEGAAVVGDILDVPGLSFSTFDTPDVLADLVETHETQESNVPEPIEDEFEIDAEMLEVFAMEAEELLSAIETNLELLAAQPENSDALWEIRRNAHTLKGAAGIVGLKKPSKLAHRVEDLLDTLKEQGRKSNEGIFTLLHSSANCLRMLTAGKNSPELDAELERLYGEFEKALVTVEAEPQQIVGLEQVVEVEPASIAPSPIIVEPAPPKAEPPAEPPSLETQPPAVSPATVDESAPKPQRAPVIRVSMDRLDELVDVVHDLVVSRSAFEQQLRALEQHIEDLHNSARRLQSTSSRLEIEFEASMLSSTTVGPHFNVSSTAGGGEHFDPLEMDRYTEFHQSTRELTETANDTFSVGNALEALRENVEKLFDRQRCLIDRMQERVMNIRMVEFGALTQRLQRAVRVTCDEEGKKAELKVENGHVEIDTQILDGLVEPLMHLLKNAVVHGIEYGETRRLLGKPETGQITVRLDSDQTHVTLSVRDDGRGINIEPLKEKAVAAGHLSREAADRLSPEEALNLVFLAGLTTAEKINLSAGRGVGMSIVKESVVAKKGTVSIATEPQKGSVFTLRVPLPMAVTNALIATAGHQSYAMPVKQVMYVGFGPLILGDGRPRVNHNGQECPCFFLEELVNRNRTRHREPAEVSYLLMDIAGEPAAVVVDEVLRTEEVVIKPLEPPLNSLQGLLGVAILGSGQLVTILDMSNLLQTAPIEPQTAQPVSVETTETIVLIVDDSPSVRHMSSMVVQNAGWTAETAKDGVDALEKLRSARILPAVILSDIEMPRMDGFEFVAALKANDRLRDIPVIMITSRTGDKHRERASAAGVTDYLTKPYENSELVAMITRLTNSRVLA